MLARKLTVAVLLVAMGLSACGSSSKSTGSKADGSTSPTVAGAGGQTSSGDTTTTTTADSSDGGGGGGGDFCALMRKDDKAFSGADIETKSPKDLKALYANVLPELKTAASKAPGEIKSDLDTLVASFKVLVDALDKVNYDVTKLNPDSLKSLGDPKFEAASVRISTYLAKTCGIKEG